MTEKKPPVCECGHSKLAHQKGYGPCRLPNGHKRVFFCPCETFAPKSEPADRSEKTAAIDGL